MENTKNKNENNGNQNVSANLQSGNYGNFLKKNFTCIEYMLVMCCCKYMPYELLTCAS